MTLLSLSLSFLNKPYVPSTLHVCLIFSLRFSGAVNAAHQLGVASLDVRGAFRLAHQPASDKNGPHVHFISLTSIGSRAVRGQSTDGLAHKQRRALGHIWPANTFCVSRHTEGNVNSGRKERKQHVVFFCNGVQSRPAPFELLIG